MVNILNQLVYRLALPLIDQLLRHHMIEYSRIRPINQHPLGQYDTLPCRGSRRRYAPQIVILHCLNALSQCLRTSALAAVIASAVAKVVLVLLRCRPPDGAAGAQPLLLHEELQVFW